MAPTGVVKFYAANVGPNGIIATAERRGTEINQTSANSFHALLIFLHASLVSEGLRLSKSLLPTAFVPN